jgi:hypothetical protein
VYQIVNFSVLIFGMMLTTLYDPRGFELFLIASILVSLAAVPIGFTRASTPAPVQSVTLRIGRLFKLSP